MSFENLKSSGPLQMTAAQAKDIFEKRIVPSIGAKGPRPQRPTFIMVAGQPGSGKSTAIRQAEMGLPGATQKIIGDDFDAFVPGHHDMARIRPADAVGYAREAGSGSFIQETVRRAERMRANLILECAVPAGSAQHAARYRQMGYRSELHIVATPHYQSWTGVLDRAEKALSNGHIGTNVLCPRDAHDETYAGWARAVFDAEQQMQYDRVVITRRDGNVMYDNHLVRQRDGTVRWAKPAQGLESLLVERHRAVSGVDASRAKEAWDRIVNSPHMKSDPYLNSLPLRNYQSEIVNFVESEASRVILPSGDTGKFSTEALKQWHQHITADLSFARSSRHQFGHSEEFDRRTHQYGTEKTGVAEQYYRSKPITRPENMQSQERAGIRNFSLRTGIKRLFDRLRPGTGAPSASGKQNAANKVDPPKLKRVRRGANKEGIAIANETDRSRRSTTRPKNTQFEERAGVPNFSLPTGTKRTQLRVDPTSTHAPSKFNNARQARGVEPIREDTKTFDGGRVVNQNIAPQMNHGRGSRHLSVIPEIKDNAAGRDSGALHPRIPHALDKRDRTERSR